MKIVIISPSLKLGGIERALTVIANEWARQGIEVVFVSCLINDPFYTLEHTIKIVAPPFKRAGGLLNKLLFYPRLLLFIRRAVQQNHPDKVLVFGDWFSPITLLALWKTGFPVYISDRTIPNYPFSFPIPQLKKWLYPSSAGFIAQTARAKAYKEQIFGSQLRIQVIPNALPEFSATTALTEKQECKIIYVGRFAWEKDPELLIRAMVPLVARYPQWKLEMAGTGPLLLSMQSLVKELNIDANVVFLGNVQQVAALYSSAQLLVLPSVIEGFPNTLIEAMSFGLPCVCFNDIPYEAIITDGVDGLVVSQRSPEHLAKAIEKLIEDKELRERIGSSAKTSVQRFAKEKIAQELLEFMKS
jgi:glycosyltransferase involved in cell wall biosynthesis